MRRSTSLAHERVPPDDLGRIELVVGVLRRERGGAQRLGFVERPCGDERARRGDPDHRRYELGALRVFHEAERLPRARHGQRDVARLERASDQDLERRRGHVAVAGRVVDLQGVQERRFARLELSPSATSESPRP